MTPSFSPQFSQRWANTSKHIRQAITDELLDIIKLLQPETDLHTFSFTHKSLSNHISLLEGNPVSQELLDPVQEQNNHTRDVVKTVVNTVVNTDERNLHDGGYLSDKTHFNEEQLAIIANIEKTLNQHIENNMSEISIELKEWLRSEVHQQLINKSLLVDE